MPQAAIIHRAASLEEAQAIIDAVKDRDPNEPFVPFFIATGERRELLAALARVRHGVFGFDNTLHPGSQWQALREFLGEPRDAIWQTRVGERPINGVSVTARDQSEQQILWMDPGKKSLVEQAALQSGWTSRLVETLAHHGLTRADLKMIAVTLPMRAGVNELFQMLSKRCIVSWGLRELIFDWAQSHRLFYGLDTSKIFRIAATHLSFDDQGRVCGYHPESLVVNATKFEAAERFREKHLVSEGVTLTVGDSVFDADMMPELFVGVNLLILPPGNAHDALADFRRHRLERAWNKITCILVADDFRPLIALMKESSKRFNSMGLKLRDPIPKEKILEWQGKSQS